MTKILREVTKLEINSSLDTTIMEKVNHIIDSPNVGKSAAYQELTTYIRTQLQLAYKLGVKSNG